MSRIIQLIRDYKRVIIYAIVGGVNTGVDFGVFHLLYLFTPISAAFSQAVSYTAGVACSFVLNRNVTFRDGNHPGLAQEAGRFVVVNLISLGVSVLGIHLLVLAGLHTTVAKVLITVLTAGINYFGYKIFVFRVKGR
ncbi:MAG: GtrA family protein [Oscillospiraceae bacterium]|nr:GtrA family protein [Oscillospiraceae bacterium]